MTQNGFKDLHFKLDDQDIIIRVKPILDHQNNWTGDVHLQVIDSVENPLSDRDFNDIMFFARMCLVGIDLLRTDEEWSKKVYQVVRNELENETKPKIVGRQDNVITVDFKAMKEKLNGSA
jgi:hypothetical protein|tara:strand:- start:163 stop:522 length:360 start_codon:yes stop_codon:yes gene_type:complete